MGGRREWLSSLIAGSAFFALVGLVIYLAWVKAIEL